MLTGQPAHSLLGEDPGKNCAMAVLELLSTVYCLLLRSTRVQLLLVVQLFSTP